MSATISSLLGVTNLYQAARFGSFRSPSPSISPHAAVLGSRDAVMMPVRPPPTDRAAAFLGALDRARSLADASSTFLSADGNTPVQARREVLVSGGGLDITGAAVDSARVRTFGLTVNSIAGGQQTSSDSLAAAAAHDFGVGQATFRVTRGAETFDLSVDLDALTDNQDVLEAVAGAISSAAGIGIGASVSTDAATGSAALLMTSNETGAGAAFTLGDLSGSLLQDAGLRTDRSADLPSGAGGIVTAARDAEYAIDSGAVQTSASNTIRAQDGQVSLTLADTTSGSPVTVTVQADVTAVADEIEALAEAWNDQMSYIAANPDELTTRVADQLMDGVGHRARQLNQIGITLDQDGIITIDREELEASIPDRFGRVTSLVVGPGGLADTSLGVSRDLLRAPGDYVDPATAANSDRSLDLQLALSRGLFVDLLV